MSIFFQPRSANCTIPQCVEIKMKPIMEKMKRAGGAASCRLYLELMKPKSQLPSPILARWHVSDDRSAAHLPQLSPQLTRRTALCLALWPFGSRSASQMKRAIAKWIELVGCKGLHNVRLACISTWGRSCLVSAARVCESA